MSILRMPNYLFLGLSVEIRTSRKLNYCGAELDIISTIVNYGDNSDYFDILVLH